MTGEAPIYVGEAPLLAARYHSSAMYVIGTAGHVDHGKSLILRLLSVALVAFVAVGCGGEGKPAPTPTRTRTPPTPPSAVNGNNCHPSYVGTDAIRGGCIQSGIGDYDCAGGSGNGPNYATSNVRVVGPDTFDLDRDNDNIGCDAP